MLKSHLSLLPFHYASGVQSTDFSRVFGIEKPN
jgi:hypothetical protein